MSRRDTREAVFKLIYETELCGEINELSVEQIKSGIEESDYGYFEGVFTEFRSIIKHCRILSLNTPDLLHMKDYIKSIFLFCCLRRTRYFIPIFRLKYP